MIEDDPEVMLAAIKEWTSGKGVNVILDLVGSAYLAANLIVMARLGRMIQVGTTSGSRAMLDFGVMMSKRLMIRGTVLRSRTDEEKATATRLFAEHVVPLLKNGSVKPVIDRTYKLDEIREAHFRMESNENFGKIVLEIE